MKRQLVHFFAFLFLPFGLIAQQPPKLSDDAYISVMTCSVGSELYSMFGHTAFRVQDSVLGLDVVYNYGTFDFNKPNFYMNFAKGKLIYSLSRRSFERFLFEYEYEKRWVREQILDLNPQEVNAVFQFLEQNYLPENRDYAYDPLFNNCSNITGLIIKDQFGEQIEYGQDHLEKLYSFRQLVRHYLPTNSWGAFGIELAFGGVTDRTATLEEHMFLPYQTMRQFNNTTKNGRPLVKRQRTILNYPEFQRQGSFITSPLFWFLLLLSFVLAITYLDNKHGTRNRWLDFLLFLISGLTGIFILLLWLATDHVVTGQNFNFLWLLPSNVIVAFKLLSNDREIYWLKNYLWVALASLGLILLLWIFSVQLLSPLNVILMMTLVVRYFFLMKRA